MTKGKNGAAQAGGFIITTGILLGAIGGIVAGQPSIGFLVGLGLGIAIALLLWWKDRR